MIFRQWEQVLLGQKTQTRRILKPGERLVDRAASTGRSGIGVVTPADRWRFWIGQHLPVIPKRGEPMVWYRFDPAYMWRPRVWHTTYGNEGKVPPPDTFVGDWQPLRVQIVLLRIEPIQQITEADAIAEGVAGVEAYLELWESINGKSKGSRWDDNPQVVVISFPPPVPNIPPPRKIEEAT